MRERELATVPEIETKPTDLIHSLPVSKTAIHNAVMDVVEKVSNGILNPLEAIVHLKALETFCKDCRSQIEYTAICEGEKHGSKTFGFLNAEIQLKPTKTDYNYSICNDPVLGRLEIDLQWAKDKVEERKEFLKHVPDDQATFVDTETGEVVTLHKPLKTSKNGIAITIK